MLKIGSIVQGKIERIDEQGNGVLKVKQDYVLIRNVLVNEQVKVKIEKRIKDAYLGSIVNIVVANKHRIKPKCGIYDKCGSCHLLHLDEVGQKEYKEQYLKNLVKQAKLPLKVDGVKMMDDPYAYRNKIIIGFQKGKQGVQAGFYEEFSHRIIPYTKCLLHPPICDDIIQSIVSLVKKFRLEPYDERNRRGILRHVLIRYGMVSKQIMVVFVCNNKVVPNMQAIIKSLTTTYPEIKSIVLNVNTRKTSIVLGNDEKVLYGKGYIEDTLCGLNFRISPKSFYQINHEQCEVLYQKAIDLLHLSGNEVLLDAYCGIGTIGMYASKYVKEVIGVEVNQDAVNDAKRNAKENGVNNIRFVCEDASSFMVKRAKAKQHIDVVVMDPPRAGSSEEFIKSVAYLKPKQVVYISCGPQSQMRDLKWFAKYGYNATNIEGVDMFPQTLAVETVVLLSKGEDDSKKVRV